MTALGSAPWTGFMDGMLWDAPGSMGGPLPSIGLRSLPVFSSLGIADPALGRHSGVNSQTGQDPAVQHDPTGNHANKYQKIPSEHGQAPFFGTMHGSLSHGLTSTVR